jgi:hypothetical protein
MITKKPTYNLTIPEWRDSTQQDIYYNPSTPDVNLTTIMFKQNLRCNVIRASNNIHKHVPCTGAIILTHWYKGKYYLDSHGRGR